MRFLMRSLVGVLILALTLALLLGAVGTMIAAFQEDDEDGPGRPSRERRFTVDVATVEVGTVHPSIVAYGTVEAAQSLELRAATPGRVVELSPAMVEGGRAAAGEVLLRVDPAPLTASRDLAASDLADAEADLADAEAGLSLAANDLAAATVQRDLRAAATERATEIARRGVGTDAAVEDAELAQSTAEQAVVGRRQALAQAEARAARAAIAVTRARISLAEAERLLQDATLRAPFAGVLTDVTVVAGGLLTANERLGTLIDPSALDAAVQVSAAEFARLLGPDGRLIAQPATAIGPSGEAVKGELSRAGIAVGQGETGRRLFARLDGAEALRPGDFVTLRIEEPPLDGVTRMPATAVAADGGILLISDQSRLEAAQVQILRRSGDDVVVAGAPVGRQYVTRLQPQLGPGILVEPADRSGPAAAAPAAAPTLISLAPDRRARLVAYVEGGPMPAEVKERLLGQLQSEAVPAAVVERLEARMGG